MRVALIVNQVVIDRHRNLHKILCSIVKAASVAVQLLLFPEACLTGLINNDNPTHDIPLGEPIPGPVTNQIGHLCQQYRMWMGLGLLVREEGRLYDSVVQLDNEDIS